VGSGGASLLKHVVTEAINEHLRPLRMRRAELADDAGLVRSVLAVGAERANEEANRTLADVHAVLGMHY
jgi:tryptophanyl-tRNA synthetase